MARDRLSRLGVTAVTETVANACAILSAIDLVSANEVFDVTATTIPRSGHVMNDVEPPSKVRLAWLASRVGSP